MTLIASKRFLLFSRVIDLSLSDIVLLYAGEVFSLAGWVVCDELPGSVETLAA
jgi:hypothetical protein